MRSLPMVQPVLRWRKACAVAGWDPIDDTSWHQMQAEGRGLMSSSLFLVYNRIITCSFNHQWYPDLLYTYFGPVCCIKSPSRLVTLGEAQGAWSNGEDGKKKPGNTVQFNPFYIELWSHAISDICEKMNRELVMIKRYQEFQLHILGVVAWYVCVRMAQVWSDRFFDSASRNYL